MQISEFDYDLPEHLIAQNPAKERDASRMLLAARKTNTLEDLSFSDFPGQLKEGDLLVLNNTKVFPARLFGRSETGARIELFLIQETNEKIWEALARPGKRLKAGKKIHFSEKLSAEVVEKRIDGKAVVKFETEENLNKVLDEIGKTPLPPYIKREMGDGGKDRKRYQTVYAKKRGAIAAPTAGLHFTSEIMDEIKSRGVNLIEITLHVGYGTFEPVRVEDLSEHKVMAERFEISESSAAALNKANLDGKRIIAVGTTTTRALESCLIKHKEFVSGNQVADLTITPRFTFGAIDGLLTNFHLPKSSLLVLVSTFGGYDFIMNAYKHAVSKEYRFYSYGDCIFIV